MTVYDKTLRFEPTTERLAPNDQTIFLPRDFEFISRQLPRNPDRSTPPSPRVKRTGRFLCGRCDDQSSARFPWPQAVAGTRESYRSVDPNAINFYR